MGKVLDAPEIGDRRDGSRPQRGYRDVFEAFGEVAGAISDETELDNLLHMIASRVCALLSVKRCSLYLRDEKTGLFHGQVGETGRSEDEAIKRLTAGIESDGFTKEILATKEPVLIRDTRTDPRPVRAVMVSWGVSQMLGVPMLHEQEVIGLLFVDNADEFHEYTPDEQEFVATFANLAAIAISQSKRTARISASLSTVERQNQLLRRSFAIEDRLTGLVLDGADMREITEAITGITHKPSTIYDKEFNQLAAAKLEGAASSKALDPRDRSNPAVAKAIAELTPTKPTAIGPIPSAGLTRRLMVTPISVRDEQRGYLVLTAEPYDFSATDTIVARRAATIIALELAAEQRAADAEFQARSALVRDLVLGTDNATSLNKRANFQGFDLSQPHVVCLVARKVPSRRRPPSTRQVARALQDRDHKSAVPVGEISDGAVVILAVPTGIPTKTGVGKVKARLRNVSDQLGKDEPLMITVSSACRGVDSFVSAFKEARDLSLTAARITSETNPIVAADDLGAGKLLISSADAAETTRFAMEVLGPLGNSDDPNLSVLLRTMVTLYEHSHSVRRSAAVLGVHENTIRYRIKKIEQVTGLDLADNADDRLAGQIALLVFRLQGRMTTPIETDAEVEEDPVEPDGD